MYLRGGGGGEIKNCDWILINQPFQSTIESFHYAYIFPMMTKLVSRGHTIPFGSTLLEGDQLNHIVMEVL